MKSVIRFVGLDVHAETIAVAVAEADGSVRSLGVIPNRVESIRKLIRKLGPAKDLKACYEAGPCGYVLYWQLTELGVHCDVVAPTLVPMKAGDRVKTDRRDAEKLARCYRNGDLTAVWVPDQAHEAVRDVVRARLAAKQDQARARNRLGKFLLRHGVRAPDGMKRWQQPYRTWLNQLRFEHAALEATYLDYLGEVDHATARVARLDKAIETVVASAPEKLRTTVDALQALRGVKRLTAVTIVTEVGDLTRFASAPELMSYAGAVPSEYSSGEKTARGGITKTGNSHLRRIITEAAWAYRHRPRVGKTLKQRHKNQPAPVLEIAWKAQHRLHSRYCALVRKGKHQNKAMTAVARELLGFVWAIGHHVDQAVPKAA